MKALSIKQPFAELILQGKKTIELRKWNTKFRGDFLIHAPQKSDQKAMKKFNFTSLPTGKVLGKVSLVGIKKYISKDEHRADIEKHLGDDAWGNYGFILTNPFRLSKPVTCKGKLNFWEADIIFKAK